MSVFFDRYEIFGNDLMIPFIEISKRSSDKFEKFKEGVTTYDSLSYKYYGSSLMGWVISLANPQYLDENRIESGTNIRIPLPLSSIKTELEEKIKLFRSI